MVAYFRQFLVVLLVLLQNAAPLMHAHTGLDGTETGLHLYEFEALRLVTGHPAMVSSYFVYNTENCIVSVGSAIKHADKNHISKSFFGLIGHTDVSANTKPADFIKFSGLITGNFQHTHLNPNLPRAPPI